MMPRKTIHKVRVAGSMGHGCIRTSLCAANPQSFSEIWKQEQRGGGVAMLRTILSQATLTACRAQRGEIKRDAAGLPRRAHNPRRADHPRWLNSQSVLQQDRTDQF